MAESTSDADANTSVRAQPIAAGRPLSHAARLVRLKTLLIDPIEPWWLLIRSLTGIHLPWIVAIGIFRAFVRSDQGVSAQEVALQHPWLHGLLVSAAIWGLMVPSIFLASRAALLTTIRRAAPAVRLVGPLWWTPVVISVGAASITIFLATAVRPSHPAWLSYVVFFGVSESLWIISLRRRRLRGDAARAFELKPRSVGIAIGVTLGVLLAGYLLLAHRMQFLASLGPFGTTLVGLFALAALVQLVMVALPGAMKSATWALAFLALGSVLHACQSPIIERPNPFLASALDGKAAPETHPEDGADVDAPCRQLIATNAAKGDAAAPAAGASASSPDTTLRTRFLISAEGGGLRAAYWTAIALEQFSQRRKEPLIDDATLLSGVSGGSLGLATWIAAQRLPKPARLECIKAFLGKDFLTPLTSGLLFLDVPRLVLPRTIASHHRGDYFEKYLAEQWRTLTGDTFFYDRLDGLTVGKNEARVFFNATDAVSGQFVTFGNGAPPPATGAGAGSNRLNLALVAALPDLRVAQAVHFSARFLYLSPTPDVEMTAAEAAQALGLGKSVDGEVMARVATLVDGGYFDNSGLGPALRTLEDDRWLPKETRAKSRPVVIHLLNAQERSCEESPDNTACKAVNRKRLEALERSDTSGWLTRPLQAIIAVRESHSLQRINEVKTSLAMTQRLRSIDEPKPASSPHGGPPVQRLPGSAATPDCKALGCSFEPMALTFPDEKAVERPWYCFDWLCGEDRSSRQVALGWMLSSRERELMDERARALADNLIKRYP